MATHAAAPVAVPLDGAVHRVYFASRDGSNRSHVGYVDIDLGRPSEIIRLSERPVLEPGPLGYFDAHGVYASSIIEHEGTLRLYYIGWNPGHRAPLFYSAIGMATSDDGGDSFQRASAAPILDRGDNDPCLVTAPCVLIDGGVWRMWYVSGFRWEEDESGLHSYYHVKYAESSDGRSWERDGRVCIELEPGERNIGRPCVVRDGDGYRMWYSSNRGDGYRIGYAESPDGYDWTRLDDRAGIGPSESGWDSQALAYPWVFSYAGERYMLYNGNDYGREGFGLAVGD
jgi:predicted GH43/DUF377 family glycosyl hydrolase